MITSMINLLDVAGLKAVDFAKSVPRTVYGAIMVLLLVSISQPAQAATVNAAGNNPMSYIGCPSLVFVNPLAPTAQQLTGMVFGVVIVIIMVLMIAYGIRILVAGSREDRARDGIAGVKNLGVGAGILFIGIPIAGAIVWGLAIAVNPNC